MRHNLDETIDFLRAFAPNGPVNLCALEADTGRVEGATFSDPGDARTWLEQRVGSMNLYYTVNPSPHPTGDAGRVRKVDIPHCPYIHADLDVDKEVDGRTLEQRKADLLDEFNASERPPTFVTDSGGGLQPLWALDAPVSVADAEAMNRALLEKYGGDPGTWNADRLLRLPGTINFPSEKKRQRGRVVAPTRLLASTGEVHSAEAFGRIDAPAKAEADIVLGAPEEVDIETLGLSERLLTIVRKGEIPGEVKPGDNSDSGWLFDGVINMLRHGVVPEQVLWMLFDPGLGISASVLKRPEADQLRYAEHQVRSALALIEGERQADVKDMGELDAEWLEGGEVPEKADTNRPARFKRFSISELLKLPDPVWTVAGWIIERSLVMLFGQTKSFKTFTALDLALRIALGWDYHGYAVKRGRATYVVGEGHPGEMRNRVLAWCKDNRVNPEELDGWFDLVIVGVHVDNAEALKEYIETDPEPCDVTFLDTVNRTMEGDESSTKDMTRFVAGCDVLRRKLKTAVIVIHHTGLDTTRERGSTVLRAAADTRLQVTKKGDVVTLTLMDQRAGPPGAKLHFHPVTVPVRGFDGPESIAMRLTDGPSTEGYQGTESTKRVPVTDLMLLRIHDEKPASYPDLQSEDIEGFSKSNVYAAKGKLVAEGLVRASGKPLLTKAGLQRVKELLGETG
jgi:hypothetical protein